MCVRVRGRSVAAMAGTNRPLLIAYDGSADSKAAVAAAAALAPGRSAVVVTAWSTVHDVLPASLLGTPFGMAAEGGRRLDEAAQSRALELATEGAELARDAGLDAEARVAQSAGPPWPAIVHCSDELDAAVVVAGSRGRSGFAAAMLGSTSQGILHHTGRPVLIATGE